MKKIILLIIILLISGCTSQTYQVEQVIDGDTIQLSTGQYIRLLGINAPDKGEFYYEESKEKLEELVLGENITLSGNNKNKDRYGRLLRFVYVRELFVNLYLVKYGYTRTYKVPIEHEKEFEEAEKYAMKNRLGIWS
jgi:micrococcal nuclease